MKKLLRIIIKSILGFIALLLIYWIAQFLISKITVAPEEIAEDKNIEVFILTNGVHTDIVFPARNHIINWDTVFPFHQTRSQDTAINHVSIGWGDKGFYMETPEWKDLKASVAINAAFGLGASALHITFYKQMKVGERCRSIMVSEGQYHKLIEYIHSFIKRDEAQRAAFITTDALYGEFDAFYDAKRKYSLLFTCNTWANTALKKAGLTACAWTVFDQPIFDKYPLAE